jgi:competence ComEA-like helix-hairpin-helix protein
MAHNILRYRNRGGKFKTADDFAKIYALSPEQFTELKPYISIPAEEKPTVEIAAASPVSVDLNAADTTQLQQVKGIYPSTARRIVAYRKRLGGFVAHAQLQEIKGISPETIERIKPFLIIDTTQIRKIELNRASVDFMRNHPYFNFYQAKAIYEYRRNKGKISSLAELKNIKDDSLTPDFWDKIMPYIKL